jgi:hypothetical protein
LDFEGFAACDLVLLGLGGFVFGFLELFEQFLHLELLVRQGFLESLHLLLQLAFVTVELVALLVFSSQLFVKLFGLCTASRCLLLLLVKILVQLISNPLLLIILPDQHCNPILQLLHMLGRLSMPLLDRLELIGQYLGLFLLLQALPQLLHDLLIHFFHHLLVLLVQGFLFLLQLGDFCLVLLLLSLGCCQLFLGEPHVRLTVLQGGFVLLLGFGEFAPGLL